MVFRNFIECWCEFFFFSFVVVVLGTKLVLFNLETLHSEKIFLCFSKSSSSLFVFPCAFSGILTECWTLWTDRLIILWFLCHFCLWHFILYSRKVLLTLSSTFLFVLILFPRAVFFFAWMCIFVAITLSSLWLSLSFVVLIFVTHVRTSLKQSLVAMCWYLTYQETGCGIVDCLVSLKGVVCLSGECGQLCVCVCPLTNSELSLNVIKVFAHCS